MTLRRVAGGVRRAKLFELGVEATLIDCVEEGTKAKAPSERENSTYAVSPEMVSGNDDAEQSESWVQENGSANPFATCEWPDCKRAP